MVSNKLILIVLEPIKLHAMLSF